MDTGQLTSSIAKYVKAGMHLHFASTPSRSNAALLAVANAFVDRRPEFTVSASGFHSSAHLFGLLGLANRLIGCFYGDNYPTPRPNSLYQRLLNEGVELEHWSLLSYVAALRAGAMGHRYVACDSLYGTTLGEELEARGRCRLVDAVRGADVFPLRPDIAFMHAAAGERDGQAWFSAPSSEGFHSAFAARLGVIVTVDRMLSADEIASRPELIPIPRYRVLAICEAPFGAHPQPVHACTTELSYRDDFSHYLLWRELCRDEAALERFVDDVVRAPDPWSRYRDYVGHERLSGLRERLPRRGTAAAAMANGSASSSASHSGERSLAETQTRAKRRDDRSAGGRHAVLGPLTESEAIIVLAARRLAQLVKDHDYRCMLAGIGQAFSAARLCKRLLNAEELDVELMVETGFCDFGGAEQGLGDSYLLSQRNIALSGRLTDVESVLGTLVCGTNNRCIGVVGCAEVDREGNLNSTRIGGRLLVGSGGACDITAGAREVVVLAPAARLVDRVEYITSRGDSVRSIATERGVLVKEAEGWQLERAELVEARVDFPWREACTAPSDSPAPTAAELTTDETEFIAALRDEARNVPIVASRAAAVSTTGGHPCSQSA